MDRGAGDGPRLDLADANDLRKVDEATIAEALVVPAIAGPARLVPLPALATDLLSANALRVAAVRRRLKAAKASDGTWRSSTAWVEEYVANRYKRGTRGWARP
jgi:hypothetical protein